MISAEKKTGGGNSHYNWKGLRMFTKEELLERHRMRRGDLLRLKGETLGALRQPEDGEVKIYRALTEVTRDPVLFWVSAKVAYAREYDADLSFEEDLCRLISLAEFNGLVSMYLNRLHKPARLPLHPAKVFVGAMQMEAEWHTVSAVAQWSDELIAFFWSTSA